MTDTRTQQTAPRILSEEEYSRLPAGEKFLYARQWDQRQYGHCAGEHAGTRHDRS
jgi:hypothetical protein